jgi:hypothetical protein
VDVKGLFVKVKGPFFMRGRAKAHEYIASPVAEVGKVGNAAG